MKPTSYLLLSLMLCACDSNPLVTNDEKPSLAIEGTWRLISEMTITGKDTAYKASVPDQKMIKIINNSHFSFLKHDLQKGKDTSPVFVAGGGAYTLKGSRYIEHLEFCNFREWENNTFEFDVSIHGDTLIQTGNEVVEEIGVNRIIKETYVREK